MNAFSAAGVNPNLAITLSQIYAWSIDFYGIAKGDSVLVIYEESYVEDKPLGDYEIKGAIFNHMGRDYFAIPFEQDGKLTFFDENGNSLQKKFPKSPLDLLPDFVGILQQSLPSCLKKIPGTSWC